MTDFLTLDQFEDSLKVEQQQRRALAARIDEADRSIRELRSLGIVMRSELTWLRSVVYRLMPVDDGAVEAAVDEESAVKFSRRQWRVGQLCWVVRKRLRGPAKSSLLLIFPDVASARKHADAVDHGDVSDDFDFERASIFSARVGAIDVLANRVELIDDEQLIDRDCWIV